MNENERSEPRGSREKANKPNQINWKLIDGLLPARWLPLFDEWKKIDWVVCLLSGLGAAAGRNAPRERENNNTNQSIEWNQRQRKVSGMEASNGKRQSTEWNEVDGASVEAGMKREGQERSGPPKAVAEEINWRMKLIFGAVTAARATIASLISSMKWMGNSLSSSQTKQINQPFHSN